MMTVNPIDAAVAEALQGAWVWQPAGEFSGFAAGYLARSDHSDPTATILHVTLDGGFIANMRGGEPGRWWVMNGAFLGGFIGAKKQPPPLEHLSVCKSFDDAKASNYYYNDFVTRLDINDAGEITANTKTWAK